MARCNECNGVITRSDSECYICGLPLGEKKSFWTWKKKEPKPAPPVTPVSNLLFVASLVLTLVSFMAGEKMSIDGVSRAIAGDVARWRVNAGR